MPIPLLSCRSSPASRALRCGVALLLAALARATPAAAALEFCNRTGDPIEAAIAYRGATPDDREDWMSEGWWHIEPGQCSKVYAHPFDQRFFFYYARATVARDRDPFVWTSDKYKFCIDARAFHIIGDGRCEDRGYQTKGFAQIDIGSSMRDYTLDFKVEP